MLPLHTGPSVCVHSLHSCLAWGSGLGAWQADGAQPLCAEGCQAFLHHIIPHSGRRSNRTPRIPTRTLTWELDAALSDQHAATPIVPWVTCAQPPTFLFLFPLPRTLLIPQNYFLKNN